MGYYITMDLGSGLLIPLANIPRAFQRIQALVETDKYIDSSRVSDSGELVKKPRPVYQTIEEAVEDWRFFGQMTEEGFLIDGFEGQKAGWGEDDFFEAIAPFVRGIVTITGEDGETWTKEFSGDRPT